jgi:ABC-2 type transport system ATP-binding protein
MIEVKQATKRFDDFEALHEISFQIPDHSIFGMVGSNGAGKSTLMRMITGIYKADGGSICIDGEPVYENPKVKRKMVFVADDLYYMGHANMERLAKTYEAVYPTFDRAYFYELAKMFHLDPKKSLTTFSKGMKRQAITILALSCRTEYILFDETFDGLDPVMRGLVKGLICRDIADRKATAIITSHSLRELEDTCDQLALLHQGGLVLQSDIGDLKTSLFKVQAAFSDEYSREDIENYLSFSGNAGERAALLHFSKSGSVCSLILKGDREQVMEHLRAHQPLLLESLPLTLEEVFTYEMEALGYSFEHVLGEGE